MTTRTPNWQPIFDADERAELEAQGLTEEDVLPPHPDTTDGTTKRFLEYAADAAQWGGCSLVGGNVGGEPADKGFIVNMKLRGWITTFTDEGQIWIDFTDAGIAKARAHGIEVRV